MTDLENIERYADSLYGELEAERHAHRKDNAYLLGELERFCDALTALERSVTAAMLASTTAEGKRTDALLFEALEFARAALERRRNGEAMSPDGAAE